MFLIQVSGELFKFQTSSRRGHVLDAEFELSHSLLTGEGERLWEQYGTRGNRPSLRRRYLRRAPARGVNL